MAVYEIEPKREYGPFRATIGTDGAYDSGLIRVEPPFTPGEALEEFPNGDGINMRHFVSTDEATLLDYAIPSSEGDAEDNLRRLVDALDSVLGYLGQAALRKNFKNEWEQYQIS